MDYQSVDLDCDVVGLDVLHSLDKNEESGELDYLHHSMDEIQEKESGDHLVPTHVIVVVYDVDAVVLNHCLNVSVLDPVLISLLVAQALGRYQMHSHGNDHD
jgi:hypothetical protein